MATDHTTKKLSLAFANETRIQVKFAYQTGFEKGSAESHNNALQWMADRCKKGDIWTWTGEYPHRRYICHGEPFQGWDLLQRTKVDIR
jgi:hypothetical protein